MSVRPIDERPFAKERPSGGAHVGAAWRAMAERVGRHRLIPVLLMAVVIAAAPVLFPSGYYYRIFALVYVFALAALGLNLLTGFAGQVSLGHAGFMALGAYAVAIGPAHFGLPGWLSLILGAAFSALVAFLVGRPILRLKGHYLAVATLGFGLLLAIVFTNESDWTGGPDGMIVGRLVLFGWVVRGSQTWYWVSGVLFLAGAALAYNLIDSPAGRAMRAIHDSETAASVLGIDVARTKLLVFVISAVYASVAGSSLAFFNGLITPDVAGFLRSSWSPWWCSAAWARSSARSLAPRCWCCCRRC